MKIVLLQTGKTTERHIIDAIEDYSSRIRKYVPFEICTVQELKNTKNMPFSEQKSREGKKILENLGPDDHVILLDERGKELRTNEFAVFLEKAFILRKKRIVFIVGGPYGFSEDVYQRADGKLSLSKMTFPHQLVRLLFLEQLYRVFTIIKGEPYHHE